MGVLDIFDVRPVVVVKSKALLLDPPLMVQRPDPPLSVLVPEPLNENTPKVGLLLFVARSSVPVKFPPVTPRVTLAALIFEFTVMTAAAPEFPSNVTESADVGTDWPPAPPLEADQLVVVDASHVPLPPTQK